MNCLSKEDLIFFILHDFQNDVNHTATKKHLDTCSECSKRREVIEKEIKEMVKKSKKECDLVLDNLQVYIEGKIFSIDDINIADHLAECDSCNDLYHLLKKEVTVEEVTDLDIPIPDELTDSIERLLKNIRVESNSTTESGIAEAITEAIYDLMDRIILSLAPAPAPAFLTEIISGAAEIELTGKDVIIEVGEPGRIVKILSQDDVELSRQTSNENGIVVFKDFLADKYKIVVEGYEIKAVNYQQ